MDSSTSSDEDECSIELDDVMQNGGTSSQKQKKSALKLYETFLNTIYNTNSLSDLIPINFESYNDIRILSLYGSYLIDEAKLSYGTILNYLSQLRMTLESQHKIFFHDHEYKCLRKRLKNTISRKRIKEGSRLFSGGSAPLLEDDYDMLSIMLHDHNSSESYLNRLFMILSWQLLGRINEIFELLTRNISVVTEGSVRSLRVIKISIIYI